MVTQDPVPLLDEDGQLTEACEDALREIFSRFDKDQDGALNDAELDAFAIATNGEPFPEAQKQEILDYLDLDDAGHLTMHGFIQMYSLQTPSDPEETWKDLKKHGYNNQLKLVAKPTATATATATTTTTTAAPEDNNNNNAEEEKKE